VPVDRVRIGAPRSIGSWSKSSEQRPAQRLRLSVAVLCRMERLRVRIGGEGRTGSSGWFLIAKLPAAGGAGRPALGPGEEAGLTTTKLSVIIIFTAIQAAFGTLPLFRCAHPFRPSCRGGAHGRGGDGRASVEGVVVPVQPTTPRRPASVLLHLDWNECSALVSWSRTRTDRFRRARQAGPST